MKELIERIMNESVSKSQAKRIADKAGLTGELSSDDIQEVVSIFIKSKDIDDFIRKALKAKIDHLEGRRTYEQEWHDYYFALNSVKEISKKLSEAKG